MDAHHLDRGRGGQGHRPHVVLDARPTRPTTSPACSPTRAAARSPRTPGASRRSSRPCRRRCATSSARWARTACVPGDVLITNNPWMGTGHLSDVCVVKPLFRNGRLVAFSATTSHMPDIGGRIRAIEAREVFEEGHPHPARQAGSRGPARRHAGPAPARQRADAGPDARRHLGAGQRQRADGAPRAAPDGRLRPRAPRRSGRRAVLALRGRHAPGHPRGARRHLSLRDPDGRRRRTAAVQDRAHRGGRRGPRRLHGHVPLPAPRDQLRARLHLRHDRVRRSLRAPARLAQQRGHVPAGPCRSARRLLAEPALPCRGGEPRGDRPLRAGSGLRARCTR